MRRRILAIVFICFTFLGESKAQKEWKAWASANATVSFTKKLDARLTHLRSYNITDNFSNGFNQTSLSLDYDLSKHVSILGGAMYTGYPSSGSSTNRVFTRISYKFNIANALNWSNGIQAEKHSEQETRYRYRLVYITRLSNKERIPFLNLTLAASFWLYYNIGGNDLRYFDKSGAVILRQSPDGFHRGRLFFTASSKINKHFSFSLYYMKQQEFNLFSSPYREMNVVNPNTGNISRPFDNYNVAGATLSYDINLYKSKKNQKNNKHSENY